jgi:hypothetical protein
MLDTTPTTSQQVRLLMAAAVLGQLPATNGAWQGSGKEMASWSVQDRVAGCWTVSGSRRFAIDHLPGNSAMLKTAPEQRPD